MAKSTAAARTGRHVCHVCGQSFPDAQLRSWVSVRPGVSDLIGAANPGWGPECHICRKDLSTYRRAFVEDLLEQERGELSDLDRQVVESIGSGQLVSRNPAELIEEHETFGEKVADRVASFGGSWTFIITFMIVLFGWIGLNVAGLFRQPFDPYPFILLNLVLSTLAALQAPVIMMSQHRQETKDRMHADNDYRVNLKAELEIRLLHEKIDHQLARQWEKLAELQRIQIDLLEERSGGR